MRRRKAKPMKHSLLICFVILAALCFVACAAPAVTTEPTPEATPTPPQNVTFIDPVLEASVRTAMNKPEGEISLAETNDVTELVLNMDGTDWTPPRIAHLDDLAQFPNLATLELNWALSNGDQPIDLSPLAGLTKMERLFVCCDNISDISALSGMTNMRELWIWGNNNITDISALSGMTQMYDLWIKGNKISDISALANMKDLSRLLMEGNKIADLSPLADKPFLKTLRLTDNPIIDFSPLKNVYPNLTDKDFSMAASLRDLGFKPIDNAPQVESYKTSELIVQVHHEEWGKQENKDEVNAIILIKQHGTDQELSIYYYPDQKSFLIFSNEKNFRYTYDVKTESLNIEYGEPEATAFLQAAYPDAGKDALLAPMKDFDKILMDTFQTNANALYLLPREAQAVDRSSLIGLDFLPRPDLGCYYYEVKEPRYWDVEVRNTKWDDEAWQEGGDIRFFMPISDDYRVVITYFIDAKKYHVKADDNDSGGAGFYYYLNQGLFEDEWCSRKDITVEEYFTAAFNNPEIKDVYSYAISLMDDHITDAFGMTPEELYALPAGD